MAAEAEAVVECVLDLAGAGFVGDVVQIAQRIGIFVIDCRWQDAVTHRQEAHNHLGDSRCGDEMPHHALGAADGGVVGFLAEDFLSCERFHFVVDYRAGAVGVDVIDVAWV